ncbi:MAG: hypothetical protein QF463_10180 [Vicinamibacterales bacterium]|jgi:hypothetical protein|nr:hypothetical protein [Vicinamibacterales bacterium]MDP6609423.1 hypothetical protein [Vicinamibacterales bacterium]|tara:strand:+ start:2062 stop:2691 length:630 start_codon:yes stop_codon:yes gene_type:complete
MREARIGRMLPASVHQAIVDELPARLDYYEHWLHPAGLRDGTIGVAAFRAVLSFLRQEDAAYAAVVGRAGRYAAAWSLDEASPLSGRLIGWLPFPLRARAAVRRARRVIAATDGRARATASARRKRARIRIAGSAFCEVREPVEAPLCGFYAAALAEVLALHGIEAQADVEDCRAVGGEVCIVTAALGAGAEPEATDAVSAHLDPPASR